jgi:MarR family transcriptional regulator, 2-MHQ and catechol-resistance regulon repressor
MDTSGTHIWLVMMKAFRAMQQYAARSVDGIDMCLSDFAILETLLNRGAQPVNTIGQRIPLTSGAVTTAVDRLEARGLVVRRFDPTDRRARLVSLTPEGRKTIGAMFGRHKAAMDRLGGSLTKGERATLIGLIKKLGLTAAERLAKGVTS